MTYKSIAGGLLLSLALIGCEQRPRRQRSRPSSVSRERSSPCDKSSVRKDVASLLELLQKEPDPKKCKFYQQHYEWLRTEIYFATDSPDEPRDQIIKAAQRVVDHLHPTKNLHRDLCDYAWKRAFEDKKHGLVDSTIDGILFARECHQKKLLEEGLGHPSGIYDAIIIHITGKYPNYNAMQRGIDVARAIAKEDGYDVSVGPDMLDQDKIAELAYANAAKDVQQRNYRGARRTIQFGKPIAQSLQRRFPRLGYQKLVAKYRKLERKLRK